MILLTHTDAARALYYGARAQAALEALAPVTLNHTGHPLEGDALVQAAQGARIIVADRAVPAPAALFQALPDLLAFVRGAVDIRTVDVEAASEAGVLVTRASPGFAAAVAELVVGLMVDLARGVSAGVGSFRAGRLPPVRMGRQIAGSTVGIIGYGTIGRRLAAVLQAMDARVLVSDPYASPGPEALPLPDLLERADFVICLAVATPETANLIDAAALDRMKQGAFFINASRGELVDDSALLAALDSGRLAGAALDVGRAPDQMPAPALATRSDVVATPHIGGLTAEAAEHQALETVRQTAAILRGEAPEGAVNPQHASRLLGASVPRSSPAPASPAHPS